MGGPPLNGQTEERVHPPRADYGSSVGIVAGVMIRPLTAHL